MRIWRRRRGSSPATRSRSAPNARSRSGGRTLVAAATARGASTPAALRAAYRAARRPAARRWGRFVRPAGRSRAVSRDAHARRVLYQTPRRDRRGARQERAAPAASYLCERMLGACTDPLEATYVIKIVTGELRIGLREGSDRAMRSRAAFSARSGRGSARGERRRRHRRRRRRGQARHARARSRSPTTRRSRSCSPPPIAYGGDYKDLAPARGWSKTSTTASACRRTSRRSACRSSRARSTTSPAAYPEIVAALRALPGSLVLDGEIVAERDGRVLPFRYLQARLQRKDVSAELLAEVPVRYVAFDALARRARFLLDEPLAQRRAVLAEALGEAAARIELAPWSALERAASADDVVHGRFDAARERGHEGLMFKRTDSPYAPGRRGKSWLKLKRELCDARLRRRRRGVGPRPARAGALRLHVRRARCGRSRPDRQGVQRPHRRRDRRDDGVVSRPPAARRRRSARVRGARPAAGTRSSSSRRSWSRSPSTSSSAASCTRAATRCASRASCACARTNRRERSRHARAGRRIYARCWPAKASPVRSASGAP